MKSQEAKKSGNEESRGLISSELLFIGPAEASYDSLMALISGLNLFPEDDESLNLDAVLSRVRAFRMKKDYSYNMPGYLKSAADPLILEKTYSPEIDTSRISNEIFHIQAPRRLFDVEMVIRKNEKMITYCFRKFRYQMENKYMVAVEFEIDYLGRVVPESVKITDTNITSPDLLRCIRRTISRWKNFGRIDYTRSTFKVKLKWIF